jgi:hypothetical protein
MLRTCGVTVGMIAAFALGLLLGPEARGQAQASSHVFEIRTYTTPEGKVDTLSLWFKNDLTKLFEKHGMKALMYSVPSEAPQSKNTFIYILEHDSVDAGRKSWDGMRADPAFQAAVNALGGTPAGKIVLKSESLYVTPTDYSPTR